jgi:hypothetical protein
MFTAEVYSNAFPSIGKRKPKVVYPRIDLEQYYSTKSVKGKGRADPGVDMIAS